MSRLIAGSGDGAQACTDARRQAAGAFRARPQEPTEKAEPLASPHDRLSSLPLVPLPLLGMCVFRGWLVVVCDGSLTQGSGWEHAFGGFDIAIIVTTLLCVRFARRLTPLYPHRWVRLASTLLMVAASLLGYAFQSAGSPDIVASGTGISGEGIAQLPLAIAFNVFVGVGTALMTLLWLEVYGTLSPSRSCLCYALTIAVGGLIGWLYRGFQAEWLPVATALLPLITLRCLWNAHRQTDAPLRMPMAWASFSFPWRPALVIAAYAFAYGLLQSSIYVVSTRSASVSTVLCALVMAALVLLAHGRVDVGSVYGWLLPLVIAASFMIAATTGLSVWWSNWFANLAFTVSAIFIMSTLCSLSYHWGISAVWLFGIEEVATLVAMLCGRAVAAGFATAGLPTSPILVVVVLGATAVALHERRLSSSWGVRLEDGQSEECDPVAAREAREHVSTTSACARLAREHGLSQREEEVLRLLAEHKTARDIERELGVANGTAKAHIRHVYQKLDIHTRDELFALVEKARR